MGTGYLEQYSCCHPWFCQLAHFQNCSQNTSLQLCLHATSLRVIQWHVRFIQTWHTSWQLKKCVSYYIDQQLTVVSQLLTTLSHVHRHHQQQTTVTCLSHSATVDVSWCHFLSPEFGTKSQREVPSFLEIPRFISNTA